MLSVCKSYGDLVVIPCAFGIQFILNWRQDEKTTYYWNCNTQITRYCNKQYCTPVKKAVCWTRLLFMAIRSEWYQLMSQMKKALSWKEEKFYICVVKKKENWRLMLPQAFLNATSPLMIWRHFHLKRKSQTTMKTPCWIFVTQEFIPSIIYSLIIPWNNAYLR